MKQILLGLSVVAMAITGCSTKAVLAVNGTVADTTLNGQTVYLTDVMSGDKIDSCVIADAKFTFNRNVDSLSVLTISVGRNGIGVIAENGTVNVELGRPSKAMGAPLNDAYTAYKAETDSVDNLTRTQYMQMMESLKGKTGADSVSAVAALEKPIEDLFANNEKQNEELYNKYLSVNKDNAFGLCLMVNNLAGKRDYSVAQIDSVLAVSPAALAKFKSISSMRDVAVNRANTSVGKPFADFTGIDAAGAAVKLSDYVGKGNYALVDFWASWCGPCKREIPALKEVYNTYKDKGLVVVGANVWDKKEGFDKVIKELGMDWAQICNFEANTPTDLYGISGIPQIILFAPDGTVVARDLRGEEMKTKIAEIYAAKK